MRNKLCFVLNEKGERVTSCVDNSTTDNELIEQTKKRFKGYSQYVIGDDDMLDEFLNGKIYKNGTFVEPPVVEYIPTKEEKINTIKAEYESRFKKIEEVQQKLMLMGKPTDTLCNQYIKLNNEMVARIKGVK